LTSPFPAAMRSLLLAAAAACLLAPCACFTFSVGSVGTVQRAFGARGSRPTAAAPGRRPRVVRPAAARLRASGVAETTPASAPGKDAFADFSYVLVRPACARARGCTCVRVPACVRVVYRASCGCCSSQCISRLLLYQRAHVRCVGQHDCYQCVPCALTPSHPIPARTPPRRWTRQWYPMAFADVTDQSVPHRLELFGEPLVLWW